MTGQPLDGRLGEDENEEVNITTNSVGSIIGRTMQVVSTRINTQWVLISGINGNRWMCYGADMK